MPGAEIVATDLNQAMLDVAAARVRVAERDASSRPTPRPCPSPTRASTLVVCQFGVMFFPDRIAAYREARRVLKPGGRFLFNVWDRIETNPVTATVGGRRRRPVSRHPQLPTAGSRSAITTARIEADLRDAGFADDRGARRSRRPAASPPRDAAIGLVQGTPLRAEIEAHGVDLDEATDAAAAALADLDGKDAPMSAIVVSAG